METIFRPIPFSHEGINYQVEIPVNFANTLVDALIDIRSASPKKKMPLFRADIVHVPENGFGFEVVVKSVLNMTAREFSKSKSTKFFGDKLVN